MSTKKKYSAEEIDSWRRARWRARTDLLFLCQRILGYEDVEEGVHGPIIQALQQFQKPTREQYYNNDIWTGSTWEYRPICPKLELKGKRRVLILDPRGHLKTTINAQAHVIQWLLNYPDTAIAIFQSNIEKAEMILGEIKKHFQFNEKFRALFPEHCPQKKILDWGTKGAFTTEARPASVTRKEPSVMALSIEKGTAGLHFDVMKFSDIVEPENVKTPERRKGIIDSFYMALELLVSPAYWVDVEGTRYDFGDLYGRLINQWLNERQSGISPEYKIHIRGVYKKKTPDGSPEKFDPTELNLPYLLDENKKRIPWWPVDRRGQERFTLERLELDEKRDPYIFACQKLNNPKGGADGREIFPVNDVFPPKISQENFKKNVRVAYRTVSIDTAQTKNVRSNYTAIVVAAWDSYGRMYVEDIIHGKFLPHELIEKIWYVWHTYKPRVIKIEKTAFVDGLMVGISRDMDTKGIYLPIELIPVDNQQRKIDRIQNTLEPYYNQGIIRFVIPRDPPLTERDKEHKRAYLHCLEELRTFPRPDTDDIIDALADQFQGKDWFGRELARPTPEQEKVLLWNKFLKTEDPFQEEEA
jgi:predicted phage terminase large subunit-like protein